MIDKLLLKSAILLRSSHFRLLLAISRGLVKQAHPLRFCRQFGTPSTRQAGDAKLPIVVITFGLFVYFLTFIFDVFPCLPLVHESKRPASVWIKRKQNPRQSRTCLFMRRICWAQIRIGFNATALCRGAATLCCPQAKPP